MKTPTDDPITLPTIHLNGTSPSTLLRDYADAGFAINAAVERLLKVEFHSRDYYPVPGSWDRACDERRKILQGLREAQRYCEAHVQHASEHGGRLD